MTVRSIGGSRRRLGVARYGRLGWPLVAGLLAGGCWLERAGTGQGPPGGGTAEGGTGGGTQPSCAVADDCPGEDTACSTRRCISGYCNPWFESSGTACAFDGGELCDGDGRCVKDLGRGCAVGTECLSGLCIDGICCETDCAGPCRSCAVPSAEGTCTLLPAGTDPDDECAGPPAGSCDGLGACARGGCQWSYRAGDGGLYQRAPAVAVDSAGNAVVLVQFDGSVTFGTSTLTATDGLDLAIVKLSPAGQVLWSRQAASTWGNQRAYGVAVDGTDNIVVTGDFEGDISFGAGTLTSLGGYDLFVAKLTAAGDPVWSRRFGDGSDDYGPRLAVDSAGGIVLFGSFIGTIDFGGGALLGVGGTDLYLAKLNAGGTRVFSVGYGGAGDDWARGVALDGGGNAVICGRYGGELTLGGPALPSATDEDAFVAKISASGVHQWSKAFGGAGFQRADAVAVDSASAIVVAGAFTSAIDLGGGALPNGGGYDAFLGKLSLTGSHVWSRAFGDVGDWQAGWTVAVDQDDNVVAAFDLQGSADFGGGVLTSAGADDTVAAKFAPDGTHLWSHRYGAADNQWILALSLDGAGRPLLVGSVSNRIDFGCVPALLSQGGEDLFVAKLGR